MATRTLSTAYASTKEVAEALMALSDGDLARIQRIAKLRARQFPKLDWRDLFNESVARALSGARQWPRSVPILAFLAQTIRSVASDERRRIRLGPAVLSEVLGSAPPDSEAEWPGAVNAVDPEREVLARKSLAEIESLFSGDRHALAVLEGLAQGDSPEEIQGSAKMTPTQYASTQRRIRRRLADHIFKDLKDN